MTHIRVSVRDLVRYLMHDPIFFGEIRGLGVCLHCGAPVDERTGKERCLRREDYVDWSANPFLPDATH